MFAAVSRDMSFLTFEATPSAMPPVLIVLGMLTSETAATAAALARALVACSSSDLAVDVLRNLTPPIASPSRVFLRFLGPTDHVSAVTGMTYSDRQNPCMSRTGYCGQYQTS